MPAKTKKINDTKANKVVTDDSDYDSSASKVMVKNESSDSDNEVVTKKDVSTKKETSAKKGVSTKKETPAKKDASTKKESSEKKELITDDEEEVYEEVFDEESEPEKEETADEKEENKSKKKTKETFASYQSKLFENDEKIKNLTKEEVELEKKLATVRKQRTDLLNMNQKIHKALDKSHNDDITRVQKEKPKRKGNTGGFKEEKVPSKLVKFLGLESGVMMKRPTVMSLLNTKFKELGLKDGQNTTLDSKIVKSLDLPKSYEGKVIKFGEAQTFLKEFYKNEGDVNVIEL